MIRTSSMLNAYQMNFAHGSARTVGDVPLDKSGGGVGFAPHELQYRESDLLRNWF